MFYRIQVVDKMGSVEITAPDGSSVFAQGDDADETLRGFGFDPTEWEYQDFELIDADSPLGSLAAEYFTN